MIVASVTATLSFLFIYVSNDCRPVVRNMKNALQVNQQSIELMVEQTFYLFIFNQFAPEAVHTRKTFTDYKLQGLLNTHFDFCVCGRETCHGSVVPDKRHCKQWTSSLFLLIFA